VGAFIDFEVCEGDPETLRAQGAHHILGPFGADSDLRRWGLKLADHG
jgi:transposase